MMSDDNRGCVDRRAPDGCAPRGTHPHTQGVRQAAVGPRPISRALAGLGPCLAE